MKNEKFKSEREVKEAPWFKIYNSIIEDERIGRYDLLVYNALCFHADRDRVSWPSYDLLRKESRACTEYVSRALKNLVKLGYITVEKSNGRVNHYKIKFFEKDKTPSKVEGGSSKVEGRSSKVEDEQDPYNKTHEQESINKRLRGFKSESEIKQERERQLAAMRDREAIYGQ